MNLVSRVAVAAARSSAHCLDRYLDDPFREALAAMEAWLEDPRSPPLPVPPIRQVVATKQRERLVQLASWDAANAIRAASVAADVFGEEPPAEEREDAARIALTSAAYADWHWSSAATPGFQAAKREHITHLIEVAVARKRDHAHIARLRGVLDRLPAGQPATFEASRARVLAAVHAAVIRT
jgi:hypothetical protein